jgi:hypothetical protein
MAFPLAADQNSQEYIEVYNIITGILHGLGVSERFTPYLIIQATDDAVCDFEDLMVEAPSVIDGRGQYGV